MAKVYIANTPLVLEDAQGKQFRVERGEAVELTPEQYESVAAHVTATYPATRWRPRQSSVAEQAKAQQSTPSESAPVAETKTKTQRKTKADA